MSIQVLQDFQQQAHSQPDVVGLSLNLWDVQFWGEDSPDLFEKLFIPDAEMDLWLEKADAVYKTLKVLLLTVVVLTCPSCKLAVSFDWLQFR